VEYLDSAGLTALFTHAARLELIATPLLAPVLTISGLAEMVATVYGLDGSGPAASGPADDGAGAAS
jgi:hypothetical protein